MFNNLEPEYFKKDSLNRIKRAAKIGTKGTSRKFLGKLICSVLTAGCVLVMSASFAFAEDGRHVRVGAFPLNGFFNINGGKVSGYGAQYTAAVAEQAGWNYSWVIYPSWVAALEGLNTNQIDLLAPSQHTSQRNSLYAFDSFPIATEYGTILTLNKKVNLIYEDYSSFNGLKVGVVDTLVFLPAFFDFETKNRFRSELHYYKDTPALLAALQNGEVDAIVANMMVKTPDMKLLARFGASPVYYMLDKGNADLKEELNLAIDKLSSSRPQFKRDLDNIYFSDFSNLPFSKEELDFIKRAPALTVALHTHYEPYSYEDEKTGKMDGVDVAILNEVSKISGLKFNILPIPGEVNPDKFVKDQKVNLTTYEDTKGTDILQKGNFTEPYGSIAMHFIGKENTVVNVMAVMRIAGLNITEDQKLSWKQLYPYFEFTSYTDEDQALDAIRAGKEDLLLTELYASQRFLSKPQNQDMHIVPTQALEEGARFRVASAPNFRNVELIVSILNKSFHHISQAEKNKILSEQIRKSSYKYTAKDFIYMYRVQLLVAAILLSTVAMALHSIIATRRKAQARIEENEMKLRHITNNIRGGVIVLKKDAGLNITYANDGFLELIGATREEFNDSLGSYFAYVHPEDLKKLQQVVEENKREVSMELRVLKRDGKYIPVLFNGTTGEKSGGEKELYCVVLDMTEQNRLLEQLRVQNTRIELILDRVEEIFYEVNLPEESIAVSKSFQEHLGWKLPDKYDSRDLDAFAAMWNVEPQYLEKLCFASREMLTAKKTTTAVVRIKSEVAKKYIWCEVIQYPILAKDNTVLEVIGLVKDIDDQVTEKEMLVEQTKRDQLTGLYNKEAFEAMVKEELKSDTTHPHALIFIDLDHFKDVNDTLGHLMGDRAICEAADKLKVIFSNLDIVSRFGGDEFCVFVKNIPEETLRRKMDWLVEKLHTTYTGEKGSVSITCSCGIASTDKYGFDYKTLLDTADKALYVAKESGRDKYLYFQDITIM